MADFEYEKKDFYAIFTMNRPERLNALGGNLTALRDEALEDFNADPNMRVGIVTGTGRAFSAGADLKEMAERNAAGTNSPRRGGSMAGWGYSDSPKPFIAASRSAAAWRPRSTATSASARPLPTSASSSRSAGSWPATASTTCRA